MEVTEGASNDGTAAAVVLEERVENSQVALYVSIGSVGVVGNLLTLVVLCSSASIRNKTFNMFLISQSLLDLICAAILIATAWDVVWASTGSDFGVRGVLRCFLWDSKQQLWSFLLSSTSNLVMLNVERWISIIYPVFHKTSFTKKHARIMIGVAWATGPAFTLARYLPTTTVTPEGLCISNRVWPSLFWFRFTSVVVCVLYFIFPITLISILYLWIFFYLKRKATTGSVGENPNNNQTNKLTQAKENILKTLVILTVLFFLCWVWNIIFFLLVTFGVPLVPSGPFYDFSVYMTNVNCCVNPMCYAVQYREFQKQAKQLFCRRSGRPRETENSSSSSTTLNSIV